MVEQDIARSIAQRPCSAGHMARVSGSSKASRSMRNTGFPSRGSMHCRGGRSPRSSAAPAALSGERRSRVIVHIQPARPRARAAHAGACSRRRDLGEPEIRRPAVPFTRLATRAAIRCDQRKLARKRFSAANDAQGAPFHGAIGGGKTASSTASHGRRMHVRL